MRVRSWRGTVGAALTALPTAAHAEVMDKVTPPWGAAPVLMTVVVVALCLLLVSRTRWPAMLAAGVLAALWAALWLGDDLLDDPFIGPAIRMELSATEVTAYRWLLHIQAFLPTVVATTWLAARRLKR